MAITTMLRTIVLSLLLTLIYLSTNAQIPPDNLNGEALKSWLKQNYYEGKHTELGYTKARMYMYNYIDNHNNIITGVYSGYEVSWTYGGTGTNPSPINCEHTVPQSYFGYGEPMKSDIHHLFPTYQNWNSTRSNHPLKEVSDNLTEKWMYLANSQTTKPTSNIELYSEYANSTFEPREDHKGNCARAIFYFYTMYPSTTIGISDLADVNELYQWHLNDPVDAAEIERNNAIETYQGDRNPFIDLPELVARAWGFNSEPSVPASPALSLVEAETSLIINWNDLSNENGYKLYKSIDNGSFSLLTELPSNTSTYTDNDVIENSTYSYYAIAFNDVGDSPNSNTVNGKLKTGGGTNPGNGISVSEALALGIDTPVTVDGIIKKEFNGNYAFELQDINGDEIIIVKLEIDQRELWNPLLNPTVIGKMVEVVGIRDTYSSNPSIENVSSITEIGGANTDTEAPSIPLNLAASSVSENTFILGWDSSTDNVGVKEYEVYKDGILLATSVTNTYNVAGLNASTTYSFYVKAKDVAGNVSQASSAIEVTTLSPADTEAPSIPLNLIASLVSENSFTLSWDASTDNVGVKEYEVFKDGSLLTTSVANTYNATGLTASTVYSFYVKAKDAAGNVSQASSTIEVTTLSPADTEAPSIPLNLVASLVSENSFTLSWDASTDNVGVKEYEVFKDGSLLATSVANAYNATGLTASTVYSFYVKAKDAAGNVSQASSTIEVTTLSPADTEAPSIPLNLVASLVSENSFTLSWDASTDNVGVKEYDVFKDGNLLATTATNTYNVTGLDAVTLYSLFIKAKDAAGNFSEASNSISVRTIDETAPTVPTALTSSAITTTSFIVSWDSSTDNVAVSLYNIYLDGEVLATTTATNFEVNDLLPGSTYSVAISALDAFLNESALSSSMHIVTDDLPISDANLFISEYIEGSSYNKAIEIANLSGEPVNLSDYSLYKQTNGTGEWENELKLSGVLADGAVYVIVNSNCGSSLSSKADLITSSALMAYNGNDPIALFKVGKLVDVVGTFNSEDNYGVNVTLVRNVESAQASVIYNSNDWTSYPIDEFSYLGFHGTDGQLPTTVELIYTDFESGWDVWTDGGGDCKRYSGSYAIQGSYAANIQDNSGVSSSFFITNGIDLASDGYTQLLIEFSFITNSMENGEDFLIELYDGTTWNVVADYIRGVDYENNTSYTVSVIVDEASFNFAANANIRFRCDASANADDVYIDEIRISGKTGVSNLGNGSEETVEETGTTVVQEFDKDELNLTLYPMPVSDFINIKLDSDEPLSELFISILDIQGRLIYSNAELCNNEYYNKTMDMSKFKSGIYLLIISNDEFILKKKIVLN